MVASVEATYITLYLYYRFNSYFKYKLMKVDMQDDTIIQLWFFAFIVQFSVMFIAWFLCIFDLLLIKPPYSSTNWHR